MRGTHLSLLVALLLATTAGARDNGRNPARPERPPTRGGTPAAGAGPVAPTEPAPATPARPDPVPALPEAPLPAARAINGVGNNPVFPEAGSAGVLFLRVARAAYTDGTSAPAGETRPSARAISNAVAAQDGEIPNASGVTDMVWQWGQFIDHDIDLTVGGDEAFSISVPAGDPWFDPAGTGAMTIGLHRSLGVGAPRQQMNGITAFIDASQVYGSDDERALALRTLDGTGRLRTGASGLLPWNDAGLDNAPGPGDSFFLAGDIRANEQVGLTSLHTLFVREHNYWAGVLARAATGPERVRSRRRDRKVGRVRVGRSDLGLAERRELSGDEIYELARAIVGAEVQAITYREFLPRLLGADALGPYRGYRDDVDPGIANEFATAAYRVGHTMLSPVLRRLDRRGRTIDAGDLALRDAFFSPAVLQETGVEPILRGLITQRAQEVDPFVVDDVRNFLFGPPGSGGFDLAALNIQRGRDHGLPSYAELRASLGMRRPASFGDITSDAATVERLASVYGDVADVDTWVGGLAEDHVPGALVGPLFHRIIKDQFLALRDGDRFWYENHLPERLRAIVDRQGLGDVIRRNTAIGRELPRDIWRVGR